MNGYTSVVAIILASFLWQTRAVGETTTYRLLQEEPAFRYVSGDLPCEIAAFLQGTIIITTDIDSGIATLQFADVTMHSAYTTEFGVPHVYPEGHYCREHAESMEGAALTSIMPGVDVPIVGTRLSTTEFVFGPSLTEDRSYMREFAIEDATHLFGSSIFYGEDGGNYYIDAVLVVVPEPASVTLLVTAVVLCNAVGVRKSRTTVTQGARRSAATLGYGV